jgi:hypothetical protein
MEIAIKPVLWTYKKITEAKKNLTVGEHEVRIRMIQARVPKYMATGFSSSQETGILKKATRRQPTPKHQPVGLR